MLWKNLADPDSGFSDNFINQVYHNRCEEIFPQIPDGSIDMILTDPPYKDYQSNRPIAHEKVRKILSDTFDIPLFIRESTRVLKPGGHFYCWCDHQSFPGIVNEINRFNSTQRKIVDRLRDKNMLIWVKNNHGSGDLKGNWAPQHELIIFATRGKGDPLRGKRPSNVFFYRDESSCLQFYKRVSNYRHQHGTSKPLPILEQIIGSSTDPGDIILDPYAGSLSTARAAKSMNRNYLMIEMEKEYLDINMSHLLK